MHGLLSPRNNVIRFSLNSQPFWHWKSENNRRVSFTLKMGISCDTGILSALCLTLFACLVSETMLQEFMKSICIRCQMLEAQVRFIFTSSCQSSLFLHFSIADMQRRCRQVLDSSVVSVHGEGILADWRPHTNNLIWSHWWELEKLSYLQDVNTNKYSTFIV